MCAVWWALATLIGIVLGAARADLDGRSRGCWPRPARSTRCPSCTPARTIAQPPVAAAAADPRRRRAVGLRPAGRRDRGRLRDHLGARLAAPGGRGGRDRGARRRPLLRRPDVAAGGRSSWSARPGFGGDFLAASHASTEPPPRPRPSSAGRAGSGRRASWTAGRTSAKTSPWAVHRALGVGVRREERARADDVARRGAGLARARPGRSPSSAGPARAWSPGSRRRACTGPVPETSTRSPTRTAREKPITGSNGEPDAIRRRGRLTREHLERAVEVCSRTST